MTASAKSATALMQLKTGRVRETRARNSLAGIQGFWAQVKDRNGYWQTHTSQGEKGLPEDIPEREAGNRGKGWGGAE